MLFTKNSAWMLKDFSSTAKNAPRLCYVQEVINMAKRRFILSDGLHFAYSTFVDDSYEKMTTAFSKQSLVLKGGILMIKSYEFTINGNKKAELIVREGVYIGEGSISNDTKDLNLYIDWDHAYGNTIQACKDVNVHPLQRNAVLRFLEQNTKPNCFPKNVIGIKQTDSFAKTESLHLKGQNCEINSANYGRDLIGESFLLDISKEPIESTFDIGYEPDKKEVINTECNSNMFIKQICSFSSQVITSQFFKDSEEEEESLSTSQNFEFDEISCNRNLFLEEQKSTTLGLGKLLIQDLDYSENEEVVLKKHRRKRSDTLGLQAKEKNCSSHPKRKRGKKKPIRQTKGSAPTIRVSSMFKKLGIAPLGMPKQLFLEKICFIKKARCVHGETFKKKQVESMLNDQEYFHISYMKKDKIKSNIEIRMTQRPICLKEKFTASLNFDEVLFADIEGDIVKEDKMKSKNESSEEISLTHIDTLNSTYCGENNGLNAFRSVNTLRSIFLPDFLVPEMPDSSNIDENEDFLQYNYYNS